MIWYDYICVWKLRTEDGEAEAIMRKFTLFMVVIFCCGLLFGNNPEEKSDKVKATLNRKQTARNIAKAETVMWKSYYRKDVISLRKELEKIIIEQFNLNKSSALKVANHFSLASFKFILSGNKAKSMILSELEKGYKIICEETNGTWSYKAAAKAELNWWVLRRTPGKNSAENVGDAIADLYQILYGKTNSKIEKAGYFRAKASKYRDMASIDKKKIDWKKIEKLLYASYSCLIQGTSSGD